MLIYRICHTTIDGKFNSPNYKLTKICSGYIMKEIEHIFWKERGVYI